MQAGQGLQCSFYCWDLETEHLQALELHHALLHWQEQVEDHMMECRHPAPGWAGRRTAATKAPTWCKMIIHQQLTMIFFLKENVLVWIMKG